MGLVRDEAGDAPVRRAWPELGLASAGWQVRGSSILAPTHRPAAVIDERPLGAALDEALIVRAEVLFPPHVTRSMRPHVAAPAKEIHAGAEVPPVSAAEQL